MVISFAPNKNNNQKVVEEQALWRGANCFVKISLNNLKVSAICRVQQYPNVFKFHEAKLRPVSETIVHEQMDKKCLKNTNILNYSISQVDTSSIFVVEYRSFTKFSIR